MAVFDMISDPPAHLIPLADAINNKYFTIDTASMDTVHEWLGFNGHIVTYALLNGEVIGFYNIMPLTEECGKLFAKQEIKEEDLRPDHMLPHEVLGYAQYGYLAAIAVDDTRSYRGRQCTAALMSAMCSHLLHGYNKQYFKTLFVNPTTFQGNHMVRRLGLRPVQTIKKKLGENDIYTLIMNEETRAALTDMEARYGRFVGTNPWKKAIQV